LSDWLNLLRQCRLIAIIRSDRSSVAREMALAAAAGGIRLMEITWNTDKAETLIPKLQQELPACRIGTGTILNVEMAKRAIACGCSFFFTPHTSPQLIEIGLSAKVPVIPGAMTPTEIVQAWQAGAEAVKVFPIKTLGGVEYIKALSPVISHIPLIPTGGVTLEDADQYLQAGAIAVGIASSLFAQAEDNPDWTSLISRSQLLVGKIQPYQTAPTILPSKES